MHVSVPTYLQRMQRSIVQTQRVRIGVHVLRRLSLETHHELLSSLSFRFPFFCSLASEMDNEFCRFTSLSIYPVTHNITYLCVVFPKVPHFNLVKDGEDELEQVSL